MISPKLSLFTLALPSLLIGCTQIALGDPFTPAEFTISPNIIEPARRAMPLGVNNFGDVNGLNLSANTLIKGGGFEPISIRRIYRVMKAGDNWAEVDRGGVGGYDLWGSGFLSGARVRAYRLVDKEDGILHARSKTDSYFDVTKADHVVMLRDDTILPKKSPGFPQGGWVVSTYAPVKNPVLNASAATDAKTTRYTDTFSLPNGQTVYYAVKAVDAAGNRSDWSNEANATPLVGEATEKPIGVTLPRPTSPATRTDKEVPTAPLNLRAEGAAGQVRLTWDASPSTDVAYYEIYRAEVPREEQVQRIYLSSKGPALAPNDYLFVEAEKTEIDINEFNLRVRPLSPDDTKWPWDAGREGKLRFSLVPHGPIPAEWKDGGQTALQIVADAGVKTLTQTFAVGTSQASEARWWGQMEPGKTYRLEIWLRQQGLGNEGSVQFGFSGKDPKFTAIKSEFNVTNEWKKFHFDFTAPPFPSTTPHFGPQFRFTGPGTLWMDNARIFRYDSPEDLNAPYVPNRTYLNELLSSQPPTGPKGSLRAYGPVFNESSLKSQLTFYPDLQLSYSWFPQVSGNSNMTLASSLEFMYRTGNSPETRMRPWITTQIFFDEKEWQGLAEYLAAPYDPAKDTPQTKPFAYQRYLQRGNGRPWADEFAEIIFEFGNETWHNGAVASWVGFGPFKSVTPGSPNWGHEYGFFTQYFFSQMTKSPYWTSGGLDKKIRFNMGGFYDGKIKPDGSIVGYAELAKLHAPIVSQIGHANYVGPKWETGDKALTEFNNSGVFRTLLGWVNGGVDIRAGQLDVQKKMAEMGLPYELTAYEGGPSGFLVPNSQGATPQAVAVTQLYGKSLANGVAALDGWLDCTRMGYTYQNYLGYGQGINWNSHTALWEGFRPTPGWLYLTMRNRYATGTMVGVQPNSMPTVSLDKSEFPLIGVYALRDGNKYSVFVLSRKVNGDAEGTDFGDGATPVKLNIPFARASKVTLYSLSGNPGDTNLESEKVKLQSRDIPVSNVNSTSKTFTIDESNGGVAGGMPPGTAFLYVFEGTQ